MMVVRQTGLSARAVTQLRREARAGGVVFKVVKNTLAKRALDGDKFGLGASFVGSTGVFLSQDPVAAAKVISSFSKRRENSFFPIAGIMSGQPVTAEEIKMYATLLSMDQLRTQLVCLLKEPASRFVRVLSAHSEVKN